VQDGTKNVEPPLVHNFFWIANMHSFTPQCFKHPKSKDPRE